MLACDFLNSDSLKCSEHSPTKLLGSFLNITYRHLPNCKLAKHLEKTLLSLIGLTQFLTKRINRKQKKKNEKNIFSAVHQFLAENNF